MTALTPIPAAQYLRMSTDQQKWSLEFQADEIKRYADIHGFTVVATYEDPGISGITLRHRKGLNQLLCDVLSGTAVFKAILIYDVSRWGRFQDTDESAHYEFLCRNAGKPIYYCAESFENDGKAPNAIMKTLKRVMAGEYSRDLSVRIGRAKRKAAAAGFWVGGPAPYGLRRMLISDDGSPKQLLAGGERKALAGGRVILVPGPQTETSQIKEIYRLISDGWSTGAVAREFNNRGMACCGRPWNRDHIFYIVKNQTYAGTLRWGCTTGILGDVRVRAPREQWVLVPKAVTPIVNQEIFDRAQRALSERSQIRSEQELLDALRLLLAREGRLSHNVIQASKGTPSLHAYFNRFGSIRRAYQLIGYSGSDNHQFGPITQRRLRQCRERLLHQIVTTFKGLAILDRDGGGYRRIVCFRDGLKMSVLICLFLRTRAGHSRWHVPVHSAEREYLTLICRCNENNDGFKDFFLVPNIDRPSAFRLSESDSWLRRGSKISDISHLLRVARRLRK